MVVPLTTADDGKQTPHAVAGFLVLLHEPWFERFGLADTFVAEIERTAGFYANGPTDPQRLDLPQFGPDPLFTGSGWRAEKEKDEPTQATKSWWARGPVFGKSAIRGPVGHTFEPDAPSAQFVTASFVVGTPTFGAEPLDLRWHFARVRFRRRLELEATRFEAGRIEAELSAREMEDARLLLVLEEETAPFDLDPIPGSAVAFPPKWIELLDEPTSNGRVAATLDVELPGLHVRAARVLVVWAQEEATFEVLDGLGDRVADQAGSTEPGKRQPGEHRLGMWLSVLPGASETSVDLELAVEWVARDATEMPGEIRRFRIRGVEVVPEDDSARITLLLRALEEFSEGGRPPRVAFVDQRGIAVAESQAVASQWLQLVPGNEVEVFPDKGMSYRQDKKEIVIRGTIARSPVDASDGATNARAKLVWLALLTRPIHDAGGLFGRHETFVALCSVDSEPAERLVLQPLGPAPQIDRGDPLRVRFVQLLSRGHGSARDPAELWNAIFREPGDAAEETPDALLSPRSVSIPHDIRGESRWLTKVMQEVAAFKQNGSSKSKHFAEILFAVFPIDDLRGKKMEDIPDGVSKSKAWAKDDESDAEAIQALARSGVPVVAVSSFKPKDAGDARRLALVLPSLTHDDGSGPKVDVVLLDPFDRARSAFGVPLADTPDERFTYWVRREALPPRSETIRSPERRD